MASEYGYRFTEQAETDLSGILQYISEDLSDPSAATALGRKVFEKIDAIRHFLQPGMVVDNPFLTDHDVRRVLIDNYILYYKAVDAEKVVCIIRIVYAKRNLDEIRRELEI